MICTKCGINSRKPLNKNLFSLLKTGSALLGRFFFSPTIPERDTAFCGMTNQELNALIQTELENWGEAVLLRLSAEIKKKKLVLSGELLASLQAKVLGQASPGLNRLNLSFLDSGRIKDMRAINQTKMPPIEAIEEFIKEVGISKFSYVPGYEKGTFPISQSKAVNRIAWGIAKNKFALNNHKPKKWFSKTLYGYIDPLIDNIVTHYQQATGEALAGKINLK